MPERSSVGFTIDAQPEAAGVEVDEAKPFRIAVFGDFSGRANRGLAGGVRTARPVAIDRDNFDRVLAKIAPALNLPLADGETSLPLRFASLDDFHPDSLYERLPVFGKLRELRSADPATLRRAAASSAPAPPPPVSAMPAGGSLLDQMLEEDTAGEAPRRTTRPGDLQGFLDHVMAESIVPGKDPDQEAVVARADAAIAELLRALLHQRDFQALESAWRALFFLTRRLETGADLAICLFDVSKADLLADLNEASDLRATAFFRQVVGPAETGEPWALVVGNYSFGPNAEDVEMLARIAMIARQAEAPFLAAAEPAVLGCPSLTGMAEPREWRPDPEAAQFWQALRELPEAAAVGLLLPRFLLRLP
jgi:type VI secretion system protein ImpC